MNQKRPAQKPRRRTPQQLERKRHMDRAAQMKKRAQKEAELRSLQNKINHLQSFLQNNATNHMDDAAGREPGASSSISSDAKVVTNIVDSSDNLYLTWSTLSSVHTAGNHLPLSTPQGVQQSHSDNSCDANNSIFSTKFTPPLDASGTLEVTRTSWQPALREKFHQDEGCTCDPRVHRTFEECFEATIFQAIVDIRSQHSVQQAVQIAPKSPPLSDLLGKGDNVVSRIVKKVIRREECAKLDLSLLFGIHIILYRVLRYRFYPSLDTYADIPEWLRPTHIQDSTPHPIFIDFIHFPQLRNALALGSVNYSRSEFDRDYLSHISVNWPKSKDLLVVDSVCDVILNPDFEPHVLSYSNWSMDEEFSLKYDIWLH